MGGGEGERRSLLALQGGLRWWSGEGQETKNAVISTQRLKVLFPQTSNNNDARS